MALSTPMATQAAPVRRPRRSVQVGRGRQTPHSFIVAQLHNTPEPVRIPPSRYTLIKRSGEALVATQIESHTLVAEAATVKAMTVVAISDATNPGWRHRRRYGARGLVN